MTTAIDPERVPVVIASGQAIERSALVTPVDLMERAALAAFADTAALRPMIERVSVVNVLTRSAPSPASELSDRLGLEPRRREVTTIGGNSPQWLVNRAAVDIAAGTLSATLIGGAEAIRSSRARRTARSVPGTGRAEDEGRRSGAASGHARPEDQAERPPDPVVGDPLPGVGPAETAIGLVLPVHLYPMLESVIAARAGNSAGEQRRVIGSLFAPFTSVAAANPYAWFPEERTAEAIATPTTDNRLVAEPYTKLMTAFLGSDQGAVLIMCSLAAARRAGVEDRAVFIWSGAGVTDVRFPVARPDPGSSPAIAAGGAALFDAGSLAAGRAIGIDDVGVLDVYSCFPSAVELATEALGLEADDARGLTATGGLPYFGGPGNNYTTHAIAAVTEAVRRGETSGSEDGHAPRLGLATGLGWFVTKYALGLYASSPPPGGFHRADTTEVQADIDATAVDVALCVDAPTTAVVVAATVARDNDGTPTAAPIFAELPDGRRMALAAADEDTVTAVGALDVPGLVGTSVLVEADRPRDRLASA